MSELKFQGVNGRDEFKREQVADKVIRLLTSDINISPMVIDGDWGTGKTEFCQKLIRKFSSSYDGYRILYIDAFQADHADNPLMMILSAVMSTLPEGREKNTLIQKALPIVRFSLATIGKAVVGHALKQNADEIAEGLDKSLQDAADKAIDASVKALIKDHEKAQENLKTLQNFLIQISENSPMIIFIDELDRCRPDFAVQVLEVIKHTFNVDGVKFVLVTNTRQLKAAINHRYGDQVNAQRYLDKFLKFRFELPEFVPGRIGRRDSQVLAAVEYFLQLTSKSLALQNTGIPEYGSNYCSFAKELVNLNSLSLREVETFVRYLEIYQELSDGLKSDLIFGYKVLRMFGVFVVCFYPKIAEDIKNDIVDASEIAALLGVKKTLNFKDDSFINHHAVGIFSMLAQECSVNGEKYLPADEDSLRIIESWKNSFFSGGWGIPNNFFAIIKEVISCLKLGV